MSTLTPQPCALWLRSYSGQVELHQHDFHQIVLSQSGSMEIEVDGRGGKVDAGQGVVISAGSRHTFLADTHNSFLVVDVPTGRGEAHKSAAAEFDLLNDKRFFCGQAGYTTFARLRQQQRGTVDRFTSDGRVMESVAVGLFATARRGAE